MFIGVVVVLTLAYADTAREPTDVLFFANFLAMPLLSAVVYLIARERAGSRARTCAGHPALRARCAGRTGLRAVRHFVRGLDRAQGLIGNAT